MKLASIIGKNTKVISRSWMYIILLVVCPTSLILLASLMLDSVNVKNLRIGLVNIDNPFQIVESYSAAIKFDNLEQCKDSLLSQRVSVCIYKSTNENLTIEIYFDNSKKLLSQYAKYFIMSKIMEKQTAVLETTQNEVLTKVTILSKEIASSKEEIKIAYQELLIQEEKLIEYQKNFTALKSDFDKNYYDLKRSQPQIEKSLYEMENLQENINSNISEFRRQKQNLQSNLYQIKSIIYKNLSYSDYLYVSSTLDSISTSLNQIDQTLYSIQDELNRVNIREFRIQYQDFMKKMDQTKIMLDNLEIDLQQTREMIERNKNKLQDLLFKLELSEKEIDDFSSRIKTSLQEKVLIQDAFNIPTHPVAVFFPILVVLIISFTSLILSNMFIIDQTHKPSYLREIISPTSDILFLLGDFIICLFLILFQVLILFLMGQTIFEINISKNLFFLSLSSFFICSIFVLIGMSFGYMIRSRHMSILLSTFVLLFAIIFSDLLIPTQLSNIFIRFLVSLNPFHIAHNLFSDLMMFAGKDINILGRIIGLVFFFSFFLALAYAARKIGKQKALKE